MASKATRKRTSKHGELASKLTFQMLTASLHQVIQTGSKQSHQSQPPIALKLHTCTLHSTALSVLT